MESLSDNSAEIERLFLWDDLVTTFRMNAYKCGLQLAFNESFLAKEQPARMVLSEVPDQEQDTIELWAESSNDSLIARVTILYVDPEGREQFNYELTPQTIKQYSLEPTALDKKDIMTIRYDIQHAEWAENVSKEAAQNKLFYS